MKRLIHIAAGLMIAWLSASNVDAQRPHEDGRHLSRPSRHSTRPTHREEAWHGPRILLGYEHYTLADGYGGGGTDAGVFGGYLPTGNLRVSGVAAIGARDYSLAGTDLVLRAGLSIGYQHFLGDGRFLLFAAPTATIGVILGKRFSSPEAYALYGIGFEAGGAIRIVRNFFAEVSLGYLRVSNGGLSDNVLLIRVGIGL